MRGAVLVAAGLDATWGEPPLRLHPVVWAGHYLTASGRRLPASPPTRATLLGAAAWGAGAVAATACGALVARCARRVHPAAGSLVAGVALWPLISARLLLSEVAAVEAALASGPDEGRAALARIVSRDTTSLAPEEVRAAAVESLAENLSDSVVAPLVWWSVAGLPGAALYRFCNTADAMWGYRTARWEYAGKVAARVDDVLNLVPARLTALLLAGPRHSLLRRVRGEARRTPSPNAGWPMGALAVRLDVRLPKVGVYVLNPTGDRSQPRHLQAALVTARRAIVVAVLVTSTADFVLDRPARHKSGAA
jgi:adenosylcobinamide-phosphate synthase